MVDLIILGQPTPFTIDILLSLVLSSYLTVDRYHSWSAVCLVVDHQIHTTNRHSFPCLHPFVTVQIRFFPNLSDRLFLFLVLFFLTISPFQHTFFRDPFRYDKCRKSGLDLFFDPVHLLSCPDAKTKCERDYKNTTIIRGRYQKFPELTYIFNIFLDFSIGKLFSILLQKIYISKLFVYFLLLTCSPNSDVKMDSTLLC